MGRKPKIVDKDDFEFCGLGIEEVREIIDATVNGYYETDKKQMEIKEEILKGSPYNSYVGNRLNINIPLKLKNTDNEFYKYGFEIHIYDNGQVNMDNGNGVMMGLPNPLKVYEIIIQHFIPKR